MKNEKNLNPLSPARNILSILLYDYCMLGGYNSKTSQDIKLKFSTFLSCVEITKCAKFQIPRYKGFKVDIFQIRHIPSRHKIHTCFLHMRKQSNISDQMCRYLPQLISAVVFAT